MPKLGKVICFGGGNALSKVVLEGIKKCPVRITSVTSMTESGGSTGQLRKGLDILPPGDISRHLIALSEAPQWKKALFYSRFGQEKFPGGHIGHRFGTVFIASLEYLFKDFEKALRFAQEFLEVKKHQALPATIEKTHIWAILENNQIIKGEDEIDVPKKHNSRLKIKKAFLKPKAKAYPPVLKTIKEADLIVIGPGDLYSSLIPCLLPKGVKEEIKKSRAKKVFICNIMTKRGETNNFTVLDFAKEIEKYLGGELDYVIYNNFFPARIKIRSYQKKKPELVNLVKINKGLAKTKFIAKNLLIKKGLPEHDPKKVSKILISLI